VTLWRLEVLRLTRTNRWMILVGIFAFFGALGPVTARYMGEIMGRFGGDIQITLPDPTPVDGIVQYLSNASQVGLLAVVVVAAAALAVDARPEAAAFYRTRVPDARTILLPRYVVSTAAAALSFVLGMGLAWVGTVWLIGALPATDVIVGTLLGALYLAFAVALVAAAASVTRTVVTTVFAALAVLLMLPVLGLLGALKPWLPSELVGAPTSIVAGAAPGAFTRAVVVTVVVTVALLAMASVRQSTREL
jgi:ABC-2 type transport system permease protein